LYKVLFSSRINMVAPIDIDENVPFEEDELELLLKHFIEQKLTITFPFSEEITGMQGVLQTLH